MIDVLVIVTIRKDSFLYEISQENHLDTLGSGNDLILKTYNIPTRANKCILRIIFGMKEKKNS